MAFDQSSVPLDLRPLNIGRAVVDESRLVTPITGRNNMEGLYATPSSSRDPGNNSSQFPVYYHDHASGLVGLAGYGNAATPGGIAGWVQRIPSSSAVNYSPGGFYYSQNVNVVANNRPISGNSSDQASDEGGDDSASGKKVKLMCSFGGKILPRLSDGALRYVGGQTRIISVRRDVSFNELVQKMVGSYGQNVVIKYQMPEEDLDALVSVSCHDDLENMMDEYEKLVERSMDGSVKLRVFLFSESELDSPGAVGHMGDVYEDGGQQYVEAVNGIVGGGGGIMRRESILSAASTQNSELSGTETPEGTVRGQVDVLKLLSAVEVSPKNNSESSSHESTPRLVYVSPSPAIYGEAPSSAAVPLGTTIQVVTPRPPSSLSVQPGAIVQQQQQQQAQQQMRFDVPQQQQIGYAQPTSYLQATYMDPQHEALNRTADYVRNQYSAAQMGFPTQILGTVGPMFTQQQYRDNAISVSSHQFIPATPTTMTTPSSHANMKPNAVQPIIQPQQPVRMDLYPGENVNTYRQMVVQVPGDQSYNAYQTQVISPSGQGGYGWHQAAHQEQVAFSDGWLAHQQAMAFPEKLTRFEECYMCQKALPHAHSDTVAQTQKGSPTSARSDPNLVYHSFRLEENLRGRPINRPTSSPMTTTEDVIERQALLQPRVVDQMDRDSAVALSGVSQPLNSAVVVPQLYQENVVQKPVIPTSYQVKQDALTNKVVTAVDIASVSSSHSSDQLHESPQAYSSHHPAFIPKEGILESSPVYDQLRQLDGRTEKCIVHPSEIFSNKEQVASPVNNPKKDETFLDNTFNKPKMELNANRYNQNETLLSPSNETHPYSKSFQPMDLREMTQSPLITNPPRQIIATNHLSPKETHGSPISGVDTPPQVTEKSSTMIDWKDTSPSRFQPNSMTYNDLEAHRRLEENIISSLSPLSKVVDMQDNNSNSLFSSEDPWNMRNDNHFPPPRPNRFLARKDDPFGDNVSEETAFGNISGFETESQPGDGAYQQSGNTSPSHTIRSSKEEYIKQELQAVAEGVASSVLLPYFPSKSESAIQRRTSTGSSSEDHQDIQEVKISEAPVQQKQKSHEDIKTKVPERENLGFPVSDRLGRLQIIQNIDLEELRELGSGTFGTVYHGKWRGSDVAIKRINDRCFTGKPSEQERMRADFWNEAIKLADLHHPNVVAFYGVVLDGPGGSMATVTEFMVNGSLKTALQMNKKNLDKRKRLLIAMDVAFGMEYLHGKNLVHFDLKSDNLLVNLRDPHRPICKVGDLGLSKAKCQTLISGGVRGTLPWMAPELLNGISSLVSEKVDVFSFGIVLWELLTGDEPYADLHYGAIIGGIVSNSLRPHIPEYCDAEWRSLMEKCWTTEPSERPNFTVIANKLRAMAAKVPPKVHMHQQQQQQQSPPQTQSQVKN